MRAQKMRTISSATHRAGSAAEAPWALDPLRRASFSLTRISAMFPFSPSVETPPLRDGGVARCVLPTSWGSFATCPGPSSSTSWQYSATWVFPLTSPTPVSTTWPRTVTCPAPATPPPTSCWNRRVAALVQVEEAGLTSHSRAQVAAAGLAASEN